MIQGKGKGLDCVSKKKITIEEKDRAKVVSLLKEFQGVLDPSIIYLDSHQSHGTYNSIPV